LKRNKRGGKHGRAAKVERCVCDEELDPAAIMGGICRSRIAFIFAAGLLLAINLAEGDIRPNKRGH
jgi:hypothetical protein